MGLGISEVKQLRLECDYCCDEMLVLLNDETVDYITTVTGWVLQDDGKKIVFMCDECHRKHLAFKLEEAVGVK